MVSVRAQMSLAYADLLLLKVQISQCDHLIDVELAYQQYEVIR